jgi:feruloyl esterase
VNAKGVVLSTRGVFPGSEESWMLNFLDTWGDDYFTDTGLLSSPGRVWRSTDFDLDRDYARTGVGVLFDDTNPDLRKLKAAGGKLIVYQGGNDTSETPPSVFDYYETVEKTLGGRAATQQFFRLFTIPGMEHCIGGDGAFSVDYLGYLEAWVEQGRAPDAMIGYHVDGLRRFENNVLKPPPDPKTHVTFTRPHYPYPQHAKYKGTGNPTQAQSFEPAEP